MRRVFQNTRYTQDGKAWPDSGQWKYGHADGNVALVPGEHLIFHVPVTVHPGSVINTAGFTFEFAVKDGGTVPQSFTALTYLEINAEYYPEVNDTFLGPTGGYPVPPRYRTISSNTVTVNYTVDTGDTPDLYTLDVKPMLQEVVNRSDYNPGKGVAVVMYITGEVGDISVRMSDNAFAYQPKMVVDWTPPETTNRWDFNVLPNQTIDGSLEYWSAGTAFGVWTDGQTITQSTEQVHSGTHSIKVTSGATQANKGFAANTFWPGSAGVSYIFCGWMWVPAHLPRMPRAGFEYRGFHSPAIDVREEWVPFCTTPLTVGGTDEALYPSVYMSGPTDASNYFYVDDVTVLESGFRQMPFNGSTPDGFNAQHEFMHNSKYGLSRRSGKATTYTFLDGTPKAGRRYALKPTAHGQDALWVPAEAQRQSMTWDDLKGTGLTWDQLKATGKTWNQMEAVVTFE